MPAAISCMERVKHLFLSHEWDCFVAQAPRNDNVVHVSLRGHAVPVAISCMEQVKPLFLSHPI